MSGFDRECEKWLGGELTFDQFVGRTRSYVNRYVNIRMRKMQLPESIQGVDIEQEFYTNAWEAGQKYDATRECAPGKYVYMSAFLNTNVWLHKQRGAKARNLRSPSRFEIPFSRFTKESDDDGSEKCSVDDLAPQVCADAEEACIAKARLRTLLADLSEDEVNILKVLVARGGDIVHASRKITTERRAQLRHRMRQVLELTSKIIERTEANETE